MSIDELEGTPDAGAKAGAMAERMKLPFTSGIAPAGVIDEFRRIHDMLIKMDRPLPMPTSFLIDRRGRLDVIYKGPVDVDTLLQDAKRTKLKLLDRFADAAAFPGAVVKSDRINEPIRLNDEWIKSIVANELKQRGEIDKAVEVLHEILATTSDPAGVHYELAMIAEIRGQLGEAEKWYRQAMELKPDSPDILASFAQMLIRKRDFQQAEKLLTRAIELKPEHVNAHYNLGLVFSQYRNLKKEQAEYEVALEFNPEHAQSLYRLGRIYELQSHFIFGQFCSDADSQTRFPAG